MTALCHSVLIFLVLLLKMKLYRTELETKLSKKIKKSDLGQFLTSVGYLPE